jgi:hypothetical protein
MKNLSDLNIQNWSAPENVKISDYKEKGKKRFQRWVNTGELSPIDIYCYLKARFGTPNGLTMLSRTSTSDNLIQWHYCISIISNTIEIIGTNSGIEITVDMEKVSEREWQEFIIMIKRDFQNYGKEMREIRQSLEKWTMFINPYNRLDEMISTMKERLLKLDLTEPIKPKIMNKRYVRRYIEAKEKWFNELAEARLLGASIRMLAPVLAESFINLTIFFSAKEDIKKDKRLYENTIRQQIDVRIKSLHIYCDYFIKKISDQDPEVKQFLGLMNRRNDFLHGNVDPLRFNSQDVYFDGTIPLFKEDQSLQTRLGKDSIRYIEPEEALKDIDIVKEFIEYVLNCLSADTKELLKVLMKDSRPGWREDTGRVGNLFSQDIPEFLPITK